MANTQIADIVEPVVFTNYLAEYTPEKYILLKESGALMSPMSEVSSQFLAGGMSIDIPFWQDLARGEEDIPTDVSATKITPDKITAAEEKARKQIRAKAWNTMDVAGMVATGSRDEPMRQVANYVGNWWYHALEQRIIAALTGVLADNVANDSSDMLATVYSDVASPTAANRISVQAINEAALTMNDQMDDFNVICMHTHVYNTLKNDEKIDFRRPSETPAKVPYYLDKMVMYSKFMPVTAGTNSSKYTSYLLGPGAFMYEDVVPTSPTKWGTEGVEVQRDATSGNGGGEDTMITRRRNLIHPVGFSHIGVPAAKMSPTLAELRLATAWDRVRQRENCKIAFLETNV